MFSSLDYDFMTNNMMIVVSSIEKKLNESLDETHKKLAINIISQYISAIRNNETPKKRGIVSQFDDTPEMIRLLFCEATKGIPDDNAFYVVLDSLQYTFCHYASGGVSEAYIYKENKSWSPIIIVREVLKPNDIDRLKEMFILYRGCDIKEYENKNYGQSWTLNLNVARRFADEEYSELPWFDKSKRVILKTSFPRHGVFYYEYTPSDSEGEHEVVVDTHKLRNVEIESSVDSSEM